VKFLKRLFKMKPPVLSPDLQRLLTNAEDTVRRHLDDGKPFPMFAIALDEGGESQYYLASEEFDDPREAFASLLHTLLPLARSHRLRANVLVTPLDDDGGAAAMFDLESRDGKRVLAILPYRQEASGVVFAPMEMQHAIPKLFAP
jgi:hypothetical protein